MNVYDSQNNQAELQRVKEDHQHEVASLQSMYSQRISQMNKKHQNELQDLIDENEKLTQTCAELENENGRGYFYHSYLKTLHRYYI